MAGPKGLTYFTYFIQLLQSNSHILTLGRGNGFWRCTWQSLCTMYITVRVMTSLLRLNCRPASFNRLTKEYGTGVYPSQVKQILAEYSKVSIWLLRDCDTCTHSNSLSCITAITPGRGWLSCSLSTTLHWISFIEQSTEMMTNLSQYSSKWLNSKGSYFSKSMVLGIILFQKYGPLGSATFKPKNCP